MTAFLVLFTAALSRLIPHGLHAIGINFTAVGAGLLFFGARRPRWQAVIAMAIMALTDVFLTLKVYNQPFHVQEYAVTWIWYAAMALVGSELLRKVSVLRVAAGVFTSATSFFLLTNFTSWLQYSDTYPRDLNGLMQSYDAGLPFYGNDLLSTSICAAVLFGLPVAAAKLIEMMEDARRNRPLA